MACNPSLPEPQPLHTKYVPLICLLVELKGQIATKIPAVGLERQPQGQHRAAPEGTGGGSAQPFPSGHIQSWSMAPTETRPRSAPGSAGQGSGHHLQKEILLEGNLHHTHTVLCFPVLHSSLLSPSSWRHLLVLSLPALTLLHLCGSLDLPESPMSTALPDLGSRSS